MSDQTTDTAVEQATPDTVEAPAGVQLTMQDLLLTAQALQVAAQRGAFKAEEFSQVGGVFDHLVAFLTASGALTPPVTASSAPSSDETTSSTPDSETAPAESADDTVAE
jgi:hypothetical protein